MEQYNYDVFDMAREEAPFEEFKHGLHVGDRPPGGEVEDLATGESLALASLWKQGPAIIEFGSFT